jgi:8-oxo-dGTP pyrophosphatase MutT (NUDIX family)
MDRVAAAILRSGDEVLLCHRRADRTWYPDAWDLPGGHVGPEESPREALSRELREELGIDVGLPDAASPEIFIEDGVEFHLWVVWEWDGQIRNAAEEEHDDIGWFTRPEVDQMTLASERYLDLLFRG